MRDFDKQVGDWFLIGNSWYGPGCYIGIVEYDMNEVSSGGNPEFKPGDLVTIAVHPHRSGKTVYGIGTPRLVPPVEGEAFELKPAVYVETLRGRKLAKVLFEGTLVKVNRIVVGPPMPPPAAE